MMKSPRVLLAIGLFKLGKSVLLILLAAVLFGLIGHDVAAVLQGLAHHLHVAPGSRLLHRAIERSATLTPHKLELSGAALLLYAGLFAVEGVGLIRQKHWAEWLAVFSTTALIPFEGYEIALKPSGWKIAALVLNIAIAAYLAQRAWREGKVRK